MTVPTYDKFIEPVLRFLAQRADGAPAKEVYEAASRTLGLSDADREELLPSGSQAVYKNRIGWAHDRLKRAGYSSSIRRGYWMLTPAGFAFARDNAALSEHDVVNIASAYDHIRLGASEQIGLVAGGVPSDGASLPEAAAKSAASPDDRLETAVSELRDKARVEVLESLAQVSPQFFETIVLDVLHKLGYGTSRSDLQRVGRSGDGGIDGVIALDRLGLEKVYVQAKRWQNSVGRPEVQAFFGAVAGHHANRGVFITTSSFTFQAVEFAGSVERIVLVDGRRLADLMIDYEVGVTMRPVRVPKIDTDYFDEE